MGLFYNNKNISSANNVYFNNVAKKRVYFNNALKWQKQFQVYPGVPVANTQNLGSVSYTHLDVYKRQSMMRTHVRNVPEVPTS